jgi:hypothetical protein
MFHIPDLSHLPWLYIILIILTEADCEDTSVFLLLPPLKAEIRPSVLSVVLSTFNEHCFIMLGDKALHSSNTTAKIIVLCILIFTFWGWIWKDQTVWTEQQQGRAFPKFNLLLIQSYYHVILILQFCSQTSELCHTLKGFTSFLYVVILSCILLKRHEHNLNFLSIYFQTNLFASDCSTSCDFLYCIYVFIQ